MIFENYIPNNKEAFIKKVRDISDLLEINPDWLMAVMWSESRLKTDIVNPKGGATGLIQFMPKTALGLGTSVDALKKMNNLQQLDYVYKYFKPVARKITGFLDLYLYTFFPVAIGKPDDWILHSKTLSAGTIAKYNPGFDLNKDDVIQVGEFKKAIVARLPVEVRELIKKKTL